MASKAAVTAVLTKASVMAGMLYFVLHSHMSLFDQGLIIASVSATITGIFTAFGAVWAARYTNKVTQPVADKVESVHSQVVDIKRKVGADQRVDDSEQRS